MRKIFTLFFCCLYFSGYAQIIAPDTVCAGIPVNFSTLQTAVTYTWDFNTVSVVQPLSPFTTVYSGSPLSTPATGCFNDDSGNYYLFAMNYTTQAITRLSYGTDFNSTPVVTDLGSYGLSAGDGTAIDVAKDTATGLWYGIAINYSEMLVLSFGSSLSNIPIGTVTTYSGSIVWGHTIKIMRYHGNWIVFIANRSGNIVRFDFGTSLTGTPVQNILPNVGGCLAPVDFTLYEQSGSWYMLISDLATSSLTRYDFGTDLLNNAPAGVSLGNPGGLLNIPRNINLMNDCQGNLICYIGNEGGHFTKLDFAGDITTTPTPTDLGIMPDPRGATVPCSYSDSFCFVMIDGTNNKLWKYFPLYFSTPTFINYYNPDQTYTFSTPGTYSVNLFCDMGYRSGPSVFCKDIVVVPGTGTSTSRDTSVCLSYPLILYAGITGPHTWSTGDTGSSVSVSASGTYWVNTTTGPCTYRSDTVHVAYRAGLPVNLGNDTTICKGDSLILNPAASGDATVAWSTGATTSSITVVTAGTYWVRVNDDGCIGSDTIHVTVSPKPIVNLGPDQRLCAGSPATLQSSDSYIAPTYLWNTGSTTASISPVITNTYWLAVTVAGCTGADTVNVIVKPSPAVTLGNDTAICPSAVITLTATTQAGVQYLWSTGSNAASIQVSAAGVYRLTVTLDSCSVTDSVQVTALAIPIVSLGLDTVLCNGDTLQLSAGSDAATWSTGVNAENITVTDAGAYWATVQNICGIGSDTINVKYELCDLSFPSAFTPNDDGRNDIIRAVGNFKNYSGYSLSIYNRWGQRVFYTEDIYSGWDGKFNGVKQDVGTYFYMMYYSFEGRKHMMKGDIELIR